MAVLGDSGSGEVPGPGRGTLVVIPTYQEATNIVTVLERVRAVAPDVEVLVVDDGSPDGTADLAEAAGRELGGITVLRRPAKSGLGSAYREGFDAGIAAGHEVLVEMDADLSHDPADLPRLLDAVDAGGARLAIGSRYVSGGATPDWPLTRRLLSRGGNRYVAMVLGLGVRDATAGYRAYRASTLVEIDHGTTRAEGYGFQVEMTRRVVQTGGGIVELPITFRDRELGSSKMSGRIVAEAMLLVTWWGVRDRVAGLARRVGRRSA